MSQDRYVLPDPKCNHKPTQIVRAGSLNGPHASTYVCSRPGCVDDAKQWAYASTHLEPEVVPFESKA